MRNLQAYKWDDVLEEEVPKTMIGLKLIRKEKEAEQKAYDEMNRKAKRRR